MRKLYWSIAKRLHRLGGRFTVCERLGRKWLLDNRNWIDQQLLIRRPYETEQIEYCRALIRERGLDHFFDIGANFGLYSVLLAGELDLAKIVAFEPLPRNCDQMSANLFMNGLSDRVQVLRFALSNVNGSHVLHVDEQSTGVSTIMDTPAGGVQRDFRQAIEVETRLFDDLIPDQKVRALVKLDVEGAELKVLEGMKQFLEKNYVCLQVESFGDLGDRVAEVLLAAGYQRLKTIGPDAYFCNT